MFLSLALLLLNHYRNKVIFSFSLITSNRSSQALNLLSKVKRLATRQNNHILLRPEKVQLSEKQQNTAE